VALIELSTDALSGGRYCSATWSSSRMGALNWLISSARGRLEDCNLPSQCNRPLRSMSIHLRKVRSKPSPSARGEQVCTTRQACPGHIDDRSSAAYLNTMRSCFRGGPGLHSSPSVLPIESADLGLWTTGGSLTRAGGGGLGAAATLRVVWGTLVFTLPGAVGRTASRMALLWELVPAAASLDDLSRLRLSIRIQMSTPLGFGPGPFVAALGFGMVSLQLTSARSGCTATRST